MNDILSETARVAAEEFKRSYLFTGYINSGESRQKISAQDNKIMAPISVHTLVFGRKPGKYPPFGYERGTDQPTSLMQWCMDKFSIEAKKAQGVSFVIARTLKEKGNEVYQGVIPPISTDSTIKTASRVMFEQINEMIKKTIQANG